MSDGGHPQPQGSEASLWAFAVDLYAAPGVAEACLALQDRHGCDVNVLLFAAWVGAVHRGAIVPPEMAEAVANVQDWQAEIVRPLRSMRRRLKSGPPPAPNESSDSLRARIKAIEIEAERIELAALESLAANGLTRGSGDGGASLENLTLAVRHFAGTDPDAEALNLIRAIENGLRTRVTSAATK
jgi:uncharacterized protein (TIGR02444 family)